MQPHEWVCLPPVAARRIATVHQRDCDIRLGQQSVREREATRARSYDEIVGINRDVWTSSRPFRSERG